MRGFLAARSMPERSLRGVHGNSIGSSWSCQYWYWKTASALPWFLPLPLFILQLRNLQSAWQHGQIIGEHTRVFVHGLISAQQEMRICRVTGKDMRRERT